MHNSKLINSILSLINFYLESRCNFALIICVLILGCELGKANSYFRNYLVLYLFHYDNHVTVAWQLVYPMFVVYGVFI